MTKSGYYIYLVYGSFFLVAILFSVLINRLFLKFVRTLGIRNQGDAVIRWDPKSKPAVGGFSFYILCLLSIIAFSVFFDTNKVFLNLEFIGFLLSTMLGFLLGLTDDAYNTKPLLKFFTQLTCGIILVATGTYISLSYIQPINYFITVFWVVGIMNALNMLDNMDAISSTVSISIILSALAVMVLHNELDSVYFMIMIGVLAGIIGFLFYNWHPSKIYMGDTGSQFLGVFVAAIGIKYLWNAEAPTGDFISARNLLLPLIVFILPVIDTTTVVINRIAKKQSPFVGGKDHTTHALAYLGFTDTQVALIFSAISLISIIIVIISEKFLLNWNHFYTIIFSAYVLLMFTVFFITTKIKKNN
jgi:UDP-GlcNAc:undecaprenyl-phosphate GlcNAc-1-phosphate transferase